VRDWHVSKYWASTTGSVLTVTQIVLWIARGGGDIRWLALTGIVMWWVAVVFALVPIFRLKRRGGVTKGESYVKTTVLVDSGMYAVVRHPQFISWPMFNIALMLITQDWLVVGLGAVSILLFCLDFRKADASDIDKFGDAYRDYMELVPGWNPILGAWRWLRRRAL